ncbi:MAG: hypothetical protein KC445_09460 [Anaerolineales bacterium]|nr:hypothetical protein [Anaerolineales bacterium]
MNQAWENIEKLKGKQIKGVHLVLFVHKKGRNWNDSLLQITFEDDSLVLLKGDGNDNLIVQRSAWEDAFEGDLSEEDKTFIQENGKWSLFDVSGSQPYTKILKERIQAAHPIRNQFNRLTGVQLQIGDLYLNFVNVADQSRILWGVKNPELSRWGNRVGN